MDPILADLIKTISLDAIKIIGPAVVAALATYKATKAQYEIKLKELEKSHQFKARESLLEHYKNQKEKADEGFSKLSEVLAQTLGVTIGIGEDKDGNVGVPGNAFVGIIDMYIGMAPFDIKSALQDMKASKLESTEQYTKLESYLVTASEIKITRNINELTTNIYKLIEIYSFLGRCVQMMLEKQIQSLFSEYVPNA